MTTTEQKTDQIFTGLEYISKNITCGMCKKTYEVQKRTKDSPDYKYHRFNFDSVSYSMLLCSDGCIDKAYDLFMRKQAKCAECNGEMKEQISTLSSTDYCVSYVYLFCSFECCKKMFKKTTKQRKTKQFTCCVCKAVLDAKRIKCAACKSRYYCNVECQKKDWSNGHKETCKQKQKEMSNAKKILAA